MKKLLSRLFRAALALTLLAALYGIFWLAMAERLRSEIIAQAQHSRHHAADISWSDLQVRGFPFALNAVITQPRIALPDDIIWRGAQMHFAAGLFDWRRVAIDITGRQELAFENDRRPRRRRDREERLDIDTELLRFVFARASSGGTWRIREARIRRLEATYPREDIFFAAEHLHARLDPPSEDERRARLLEMDARNVSLRAPHMEEAIPPWLGNTASHFAASLRLENFPPLAFDEATRDPAAFFERIRLQRSAVRITRAELDWGELSLAGEGAFRIDDRRRPEGYFHLRVDDAEATIRALVVERYLSEDDVRSLLLVTEPLLEEDAVRLRFTFEDGRISLGPLPVGRTAALY